jgi:predicted RNase H-like HicB family nuclease
MIEYPIVLERENDGRFSVYAPDLPGCVSWGVDREEALKNIKEAIELWIESAQADSEPIPSPGSSLAYVKIAV